MILKSAVINALFLLSPVIRQQQAIGLLAVQPRTEAAVQAFGNQIQNAAGLALVKQHVRMADNAFTMIKVFHIGDSHVKSGFFSEPLMQKLNDYYGRKYNGKLFFNF